MGQHSPSRACPPTRRRQRQAARARRRSCAAHHQRDRRHRNRGVTHASARGHRALRALCPRRNERPQHSALAITNAGHSPCSRRTHRRCGQSSARWRGGLYFALQLPAREHGRQDCSGTCRGLHRRDEASTSRSACCHRTRRDHARSRFPTGRHQRDHFVASRAFGCTHRNARRRHGQLHRFYRRGRAHLRSRRQDHEAPAARTRRQGCGPRARRRKPRCGRWRHRQRVVIPHRPDLHRPNPRHRAPQPLRRARHPSHRICIASQGG